MMVIVPSNRISVAKATHLVVYLGQVVDEVQFNPVTFVRKRVILVNACICS
jgi:hypothetical protein